MSGDILLLLIFGIVIVAYFYEGIFGKATDDRMFAAYKQHEKSLGRIINLNHQTAKQGVARARWRHRKLDELMISDFGSERVNQFYEKHNIIAQRQRDVEYAKNFEYINRK
mgnify:CR=1 FL=1